MDVAVQTRPEPAPLVYARLEPGDPGPWISARTHDRPMFHLNAVAGRYLVLGLVGSAGDPAGRAAVERLWAERERFKAAGAAVFGVSSDPEDEAEGRLPTDNDRFRWFLDPEGRVGAECGALPRTGRGPWRRCWLVLDPTLRVALRLPFAGEAGGVEALLAALEALPPPSAYAGFEVFAPVLVLPRVFEPELCRRLVDAYQADARELTGVMRPVDGQTVAFVDRGFKVRRDHELSDPELIAATQQRVTRRVLPEIRKVHQFEATRMERYLVGCYAADDGGHFRPHRDNTTPGTAHRRFAVSINLTDDFDGGEVSFPEYGPRGYKAPAGGAVVFSCTLLHAVSPVTRGVRYAFLPFLYDDAAAELRRRNAHTIVSARPGETAAAGEAQSASR